jgi:GDP-L-fucose synthase
MGTQFYNDPEPVNLGTGYEISIGNLISLICELMEFDGQIVYETDKPNGQPRRCLDTERANLAFGFVAQVDFKQGMKNTIDWYRKHAA